MMKFRRLTAPIQMGGKCEAYYADRQWPCQMGSRHVHVHWFAYIPDALGLNTILVPEAQLPSKLGRAMYLLVQWGCEARARKAKEQQAQATGESKSDK